jgi:ferrous iron transport protein A
MLCFTDLAVGETARIVKFSQTVVRNYRQRLLAMGLVPGTCVTLIRVAPLGDPVEIRVRGYALSLRRAEAACLLLERE